MPVIGITTYHPSASWGTWSGVESDLLPAAYAQSVTAVGGVALLIPPVETADAARAAVGALDGLIIAGGEDVNPARYGEEPDPHVRSWSDARDASELLLLDAADAIALPVLGICRGMQVMAVHSGGTLVQHLPDVVGHARHAGSDNVFADTAVAVDAGCRLSALLPSELTVASHHHQAVARHPGFTATARDDDGVLQAMEASGDRFAVAVQWHPEQKPDEGLFAGLVEAAREYRSAATPAG
ncbi:gamma-glutamyl-gamma-aminobutyrate hydrolase family protein [Humibacter ginsenosidimutans]|uniref:Gamma-glutamyl-gamma-aminobutyrate hydrolase family protein n=2 Tax=Humibacter ginsenosidimutans TaxID=2599293 RepID=A0A5B8MAU3_9MICO|nr:gamma-glutamyl-gamma-aminobutyrate hydrolase family protein [Humibacter ginsenosidimutans]